MNDQLALASRIKEYLADLEKVVARAVMLSQKAIATGDEGYWDGVALNLHGFYGGVERIFEDIARTIDESIPSGPDWHQSLLFQMSAEFSGKRGPVISRPARNCLDEYRGFRHVVRNVYAFNFRPARLKQLVDDLNDCYSLVKKDFEDFVKQLESLK
jgi:hypothetical protein